MLNYENNTYRNDDLNCFLRDYICQSCDILGGFKYGQRDIA